MENKRYAYSLSREAIDSISDFVQSYCSSCKVEKKTISRYRLTLEELLLQYMDRFGEGIPLCLVTGKRLGRNILRLEIEGASFDPFRSEQESLGSFSSGLLKSIGLSPDYSYARGVNVFSFRLRREAQNPLLSLVICLLAALAVGYLGMLLPGQVRTTLLDSIIIPINDTFFNVLGCAAGPMIFLSVAWGIYGIGDTTTLSRIGKQMISSFIGTLFLMVLVIGGLMLPFFRLNFSGGLRIGSGAESVFRMILDIFPNNIFSPFIEGNSLQIIFLGFLIGIAMLFLGKRTEVVAQTVEQINYIVQFLVEFISKLVPFFIFFAVLRFIWSGTLRILLNVSKFFAVFICGVLVMIAILLLFTAIRQRVSPLTLIRKGIPTLLIAVTTASSAASFGTNMSACEHQYGIDSSVASFGIPLGMVMYKPTTTVSFFACAVFFADMYSVECSLGWLLTAFLVSVVLAIATPPIFGGALTAYTVIFTLLDIPSEALAIALAIDVVIDIITTGSDQFILPFALINHAGRIGRLDSERLRQK